MISEVSSIPGEGKALGMAGSLREKGEEEEIKEYDVSLESEEISDT